jgi:hypothetical protein
VIVEGANGPTTAAADAIFADNDVLVVPDILANGGGVIVSYFEWVQGSQSYWWTESDVNHRLEQRMLMAWQTLLATQVDTGLTLREPPPGRRWRRSPTPTASAVSTRDRPPVRIRPPVSCRFLAISRH